MWAQALELLDQADRLHRQFFEPGPAHLSGPSWEPPVDIVETGEEAWILVALPGVPPARVEVIADGGAVIVRGDRPLPVEYHDGVIRRMELPHGRFERRVAVPSGRFELREKRFQDGCLVLCLHRLA